LESTKDSFAQCAAVEKEDNRFCGFDAIKQYLFKKKKKEESESI